MAENIVEIHDLVRTFGRQRALNGVNLTLEKGTVLGLVGQNGAGKTTLIKHILGLLRAESGSVRVFGKDPVADPPGVLSRIGYLSEEGDLPMWMRIDELVRYSAAFYPSWDQSYSDSLQREFGLSSSAKLGALSKGQRARAGLLVALAFRPELLLLDEPSSGLDPIVRRDILGAIIRTIADEGRTVLFSSHLLTEVEQVSDRVVMLQSGNIVLDEELADVKESHHRIEVVFKQPVSGVPTLAGAFGWQGDDARWTAICRASVDEIQLAVDKAGGRLIRTTGVSLDDIFMARSGSKLG